MGGVLSNSNDNEVRRLKEELEKRKEELEKRRDTSTGTYWNRLKDVWGVKEIPFESSYEKYKGIRQDDKSDHYGDLRHILEQSEGIEAVIQGGEEGSIYDAPFDECQSDAESFSIKTMETDVTPDSTFEQKEPAGTANHSRRHLKNIRGFNISKSNKSKAHLLPADTNCNKFWLPELQMVVGSNVDLTPAPARLMELAARLHTNKLVFHTEHNHFFDDLRYGNILAIPLYESFEDVGAWRYQEHYEMLIVCDSARTYLEVGINGDEEHVEMATREDVDRATTLLTEATKFLADSLHVNWQYYEQAAAQTDETDREDMKQLGKRKHMLEMMKQKLSNEHGGKGKVRVPTRNIRDSVDPKLYKVKFGDLFKTAEERKYIPDPLLLVIKAAVNLSAHHYSGCKLLPGCMTGSSEESVSSPSMAMRSPAKVLSDVMAAFSEIIVSEEEDDNASSCSDITYLSNPEVDF